MSYKDKPILKLYKYENSQFVLQAVIDDFQEISFERNLYQAGTFTISINYNIPNALLFERGMFVQFGNDPYDFGEIITITDTIGADGKGSQIRTITGYDSRYILKRRVIKNMNSNGLWVMTAKGELCLRNLIKDQCGSSAEAKRQLPIINTIPASADAIGKEYSVSEQFTNLYEVCKTIATQSEIGWRLAFDGTSLTLECYEGTDRSQTVQFSTSFDSLANGEFSDSSESFSNAIYVGGKGDNEERDIYEGENGTPSGLDRFESFDNQSSMTTESEYEAEALSMLTQYGQTIQMSGNGLAKCPYIYKEQYDVGDLITVAFSGKSAVVQILSVTEHWTWGNYNIQFSFGKPQNNLSEQLQLMLRKIQSASNKEKATESVKWYNVANVNSMSASDVTFNTIGFTGTLTANKTFTFYLDDEKTGAKSYNIYVKNLSGNFNLTLTTGRSGKTNYVLKGGVNLTGRILVDDEGNITSQSVTATSVIESGNNQPATSGGVADAISSEESARNTAIANAIKQSDYLYDYASTIGAPQWVKICTFGFRNYGSALELECYSNFSNIPQGCHIIKIAYGWADITVEDVTKDRYGVFDKVRICWNDNNQDRLALYVHYNANVNNTTYYKIKGTSNDITKAYASNADPTIYTNYKEFSLGRDGLYLNGELLDPVEYKCIHSIKVTYQQSRTINFANWGFGLCMGNIDGSGNFCFAFSLSNGTFAVNNWSTGTGFQTASLDGNVIKVGNANYYSFTMTFNSNNTITFDWSGVNANTVFARIGFVGMSAKTI